MCCFDQMQRICAIWHLQDLNLHAVCVQPSQEGYWRPSGDTLTYRGPQGGRSDLGRVEGEDQERALL